MDDVDTRENSRAPEGHNFGRGGFGSHAADLSTVRAINRQLILNYLRKDGPIPRVAIASRFGLSRATVSSIIDELIKENLVVEGSKLRATSKGGRRATRVHFNADAAYIVGIDIGRTRYRIYLTSLDAQVLDHCVGSFRIEDGWEVGLQSIAVSVAEFVKKRLRNWSKVRGIGLSIPGIPDRKFRMLISPPLLDMWMEVDIPVYLRQKLSLDPDLPIYLDKDANMGALGESRYGKGRGVEHLIYTKLSTGIGAGLILNGQLYRGNTGAAGEFGHVIIEETSQRCPSCGKNGCLEALAGLRAILDDAYRGISLNGAENIAELTSLGGSAKENQWDMVEVIKRAQENNDMSCKAALKHAGERIGRAIASSLINVYNPSMILLDGGIVRPSRGETVYVNEFLLEVLARSTRDSSLPAASQEVEISIGGLGDDAVGLGAVATVIDNDPWFKMPDEQAQNLAKAY